MRVGRKGLLFAFGGVILALGGVVLMGSFIQQSLRPVPLATQPPPLMESVVVARRDIALGELIQTEDLDQIEVAIELVPLRAIVDPGMAVGRMSKVPLISGEMLMQHHLADPTTSKRDLAFTLEDNQVLMAFPANDLMSQIDFLESGDLVDILVSIEEETPQDDLMAHEAVVVADGEDDEDEKILYTFSAIQGLSVQAVVVDIVRNAGSTTGSGSPVSINAEATPRPTPTVSPKETEYLAILLALSPQDALVLKHLKDAGGTFDIVLRSPTSTGIYNVRPVMPEYLFDRYQLQISD